MSRLFLLHRTVEMRTGGSPGWKGSLEKWPFYQDTAPDLIRMRLIKVITNLKSHQEKQIWTY